MAKTSERIVSVEPPASATGNGETGPLTDEQIGEAMWAKLMTPDASAPTFSERWAHLTRFYIGAYGPYRVIKEVPERIVLTGKEAVAYALSEIPQPEQEGDPVSFFDAIAKATKGKPHNMRRNFGEELFDKMVEHFVDQYDPLPESATRGDRSAKIAAWSKAFRETTSDNPRIGKVDAFLIAEATALRDSEDMRRKVKSRGKKDGETASDKPSVPSVTSNDLTNKLDALM